MVDVPEVHVTDGLRGVLGSDVPVDVVFALIAKGAMRTAELQETGHARLGVLSPRELDGRGLLHLPICQQKTVRGF